MLTINTQIPTVARPQVRAIVKAHQDWQAWITNKGKLSAQALNADLIEFALQYPHLVVAIEAILNAAGPIAPRLGGATSQAMRDELIASGAMTEERADEIDAENEAELADICTSKASTSSDTVYGFKTLIAGVEQFLSPYVTKELEKTMQPVIDAANKGPEIVEVERIVEVAPGEKPRAVIAKARRDKKTTFRTLFPSKAKDEWRDNPVTLWTGASAPAVDPFYVVDQVLMGLVLSAIEMGSNFWLSGPAASGKTSLPIQAGATSGRPVTRINMTRQTDQEALVGGMALRDGSTVWEDGVLTAAIRQPGMIIIIDEITMAPPGVLAMLMSVADEHRAMQLPTGEVVKVADGVVFAACDNTNGAGDEGGLYAGTGVANVALVSRFPWMITVDYMSPAKEAEALANHTAAPLVAARFLADFVAQCRKLPALSGVILSLRQMVGFVRCVQRGFSSKQAFDVCFTSRMPATERAAIEAQAQLAWHTEFENLIRGKTSVVSPQPSNSAASKAFGQDQTF